MIIDTQFYTVSTVYENFCDSIFLGNRKKPVPVPLRHKDTVFTVPVPVPQHWLAVPILFLLFPLQHSGEARADTPLVQPCQVRYNGEWRPAGRQDTTGARTK
jgi:hypothetical protein